MIKNEWQVDYLQSYVHTSTNPENVFTIGARHSEQVAFQPHDDDYYSHWRHVALVVVL